jgi:hypothetical protein
LPDPYPYDMSNVEVRNLPFTVGLPFGMVKKIKSQRLGVKSDKTLKNFHIIDLRGF